MRNGIIRFGALYVFNVAVLLVIGLVLPSVGVGWHALWASVILTLAALFIKPLLKSAFRKSAARSAADRTRTGEKVVQYALVYLVELIIWVITVWLSPVWIGGFWGYALPPLLLLLGWVVYDRVDDNLRRKAGEVYDRVAASRRTSKDAGAPAPPTPEPSSAQPDDGLTPEQRRMLDEL